MDIRERVDSLRDEILAIATKHGAHHVRLFGSAARGEAGPSSDVDILVELEPGRSLLDLSGLLLDLEDLLGCSVAVAVEDSLHWYIKDKVLREAVPL